MNNLIFRHKMHFNLRPRFKKCTLLLPCVSVVGSCGFWRKQELGWWSQKMLPSLVLVCIFFSPCGYVFSQLSNNLLKFCPLTSSGFRRIPHPHLPCFPALPFSISQWMSPIFSPPLHKFGSTKEKNRGCVSDSARSYHFITLWTASFPCAISVWSLSQLRF